MLKQSCPPFLALKLFLSEELGPVNVIRAPPSPGYAGDWVKFNSAFYFHTYRRFPGQSPCCSPPPRSALPILHTFGKQWGHYLRPPHALSPRAQWCSVALTSCVLHPALEALDSRRSKSLGCQAKQEHKQQQKYFKYFDKW